MKKLFLIIFLFSKIGMSQVGIGTITPSEQLEVVGDVLLTSELETSPIATIGTTDVDFKFLARVTNSTPAGLVKKLNTDNIKITPIRRQKYKFTNLSNDNIVSVNLNLAVSDYVVIPTDFKWIGPGLEKAGGGADKFKNFKIKVTANGGTPNNWQLTLQNPFNEPFAGSAAIEYEVTLVIYQKAFFKDMGKVTRDISTPLSYNNNSETAPIAGTPALFQ